MVRTFFCGEKRSCPDFDSVKIPTDLIRIERTIDRIEAVGHGSVHCSRSPTPVLVVRARSS